MLKGSRPATDAMDWFVYDDAYSLRPELERLHSLHDQLGVVRLTSDENVALLGVRVAGIERGTVHKERTAP
jgi:hypothetical protein